MTLASKREQILSRIDLARGRKPVRFPPSLHIELTDDCFNECPMCRHWRRKTKVEQDLCNLISFLNAGVGRGLETVCFSGGDPLKYTNINRLMSFTANKGIDFGIVTAGHLYKDISLPLLSKARWVRVSLDSLDKDKYAASRGGEISSSDVLAFILAAKSNNVHVELGVTVHSLNIAGIEEVFRFAKFGNIPVSARVVYPHTAKFLHLSVDETNKLIELSTEYDVNLSPPNYRAQPVHRCWASLYQWFVRASGEVYPCCIIAGDTEMKEKISASFGNIAIDGEEIGSCAKMFSYKRAPEIEAICDKHCPRRLLTINTVVESERNKKFFF